MKLTILGSGSSQGIPVVTCNCEVCSSLDVRDKRLRTSAMIEINDKTIVLDAGPDFRYQMLRENVQNIRAILITHGHKDHIGGLDDVRPFNWVHQRVNDTNKIALDIYGNKEAKESVYQDFAYAFAESKFAGLPKINFNIVEQEKFYIDGIEIMPIPVLHYKLPVLGYRIGDFAYITDFKTITEDSTMKLQGLKVLILGVLRKEEHISHLSLYEALEFVKQINPQKTYLTHISHQMGTTESVLKLLPQNVEFAYDGMSLEV